MKFYRQVMFTLRIEAQFFARFPRLILATLLVVCLPAVYTVIYLTSVWDPASRTSALPVGLVNLDQGITYRGQFFNAGSEVMANLRRKHTFGFTDLEGEDVARNAVQSGMGVFNLRKF